MDLTRNSILLALLVLFFAGCGRGPQRLETASTTAPAASAINLNTASSDELQRIPYIGEKLAAKIVEHREVHGPFRRVEHLMLIQGISDKRFRKIRPLVRVE